MNIRILLVGVVVCMARQCDTADTHLPQTLTVPPSPMSIRHVAANLSFEREMLAGLNI